MALTNSGPVASSHDGEVIQNLNITATDAPGVHVTHKNVLVYNCVIRHGVTAANKESQGVLAESATNIEIAKCDIAQRADSLNGRNSKSPSTDNVFLDACGGDAAHPSPRGVSRPTVHDVRLSRGSRLIKATQCPQGVLFYNLEGHNVRGLDEATASDYGGNFVQIDNCPGSLIRDASYEDADIAAGNTTGQSWTEDLVSVYHSNNVGVERVVAQRCNSPSGDNFIAEASKNCTFTDCDAVEYSNGAFGFTDGGTGKLLNCRAKNGSLSGFEGRGAPSSDGLMIAVTGTGAQATITNFKYWSPANPGNLLWEGSKAPNADIVASPSEFTARAPVRVDLPAADAPPPPPPPPETDMPESLRVPRIFGWGGSPWVQHPENLTFAEDGAIRVTGTVWPAAQFVQDVVAGQTYHVSVNFIPVPGNPNGGWLKVSDPATLTTYYQAAGATGLVAFDITPTSAKVDIWAGYIDDGSIEVADLAFVPAA